MTDRPHVVGGALDACIGVPELIAAIGYWELFGYRVGDIGELDAVAAKRLYGVDSAARMVRLWHQDADHGLIRLMQWERPTGPGLALTPFKTVGNRWIAAEVLKISRIVAHAKYRRDSGAPITIFHPDAVPAPGTSRESFRRAISAAIEMAILQPHYRQVLFERADFPSPLYGKVNPGSILQGSQFTHCCLVTRGVTPDAFNFYDKVLGMVKSGDFDILYDDIGSSGKDIFQLHEGEGFHMHRFDDPRGGDGLDKRSGRVIFFNFREDVGMPDLRAASRPGASGLCLYSWRVHDIEQVREVVMRAGATEVTEVQRNEFGERAITLVAPDSTPWMLIHAADTVPINA